MKKVLYLLISVLLLSGSYSANALPENHHSWIIKQNLTTGEDYLYNTGTGDTASYFIDASGNRLTAKSMLAYFNGNNRLSEEKKPIYVGDQIARADVLTGIVNEVIEMQAKKITPDIVGPATVNYAETVTFSQSFSGGITITPAISAALKAAANVSWNVSASSNTTFGMTFSIKAGKTGAIYFTPYYNMVSGNYHIGDLSWKVYGYSPKKLANGFADGRYYCLNCN